MHARKLSILSPLFFATAGLFLLAYTLPAHSQGNPAVPNKDIARTWLETGNTNVVERLGGASTIEEGEYRQFLPVIQYPFENPMDHASLYPPANHYLNFQPRAFSVDYGTVIISHTVTSQSFVVQASQSGLVTGTLFVFGENIFYTHFGLQPFHPGEILQGTLTTAIGGHPNVGSQILHAGFPMVWQYQIPVSGGGGFMQPGITPFVGNSDSTDLVIGDLDRDGDQDILIAYLDRSAEVWVNDGTGSFSLHLSGLEAGGSNAVVLGDVDCDLDLDAVFATLDAETVWLNDGQGNFTSHPFTPSFGSGASTGLAMGDLNGDGYLDVVVANANGEPETIWLNDRTGGFTPHPTTPAFGQGDSMGIVIGDVNGDFALDVIIANANDEPETVWLNDKRGNLTAHPLSPEFGVGDSQALGIADLDLDGDLDVIIANANNQAETVWLNDGQGNFLPHPTLSSFGEGDSRDLVLGDVNGDHFIDVLVANANGEPETIWLNDGQGGFMLSDTPPAFGLGDSQAVALGDFEGDGDLDAGVANAGGDAVTIWVNDEMRVVATAPDGTGGVASDVLVVIFDRDVDPASVGNDTFVVNGAFTGRYAGTFAFPAANQVVFTSSTPFKAEEKLSISLTAGIRDLALNLPLHPYVWEVRGAASGGTGVFAPHPTAPQVDLGFAYELVLGDLNGDQSLDVISKDSVWLNDGTALFSSHPVTPTLGPQYYGLRTGDLDEDGDLDMINQTSAWNDQYLVWFNDGTGGLRMQTTISVPTYIPWPWDSALNDFDGDGDLDFLGFDGETVGQVHPRLWLNLGDGNFVPHPVDSFSDRFGYFGRFDVGDLDNDGDLDLLTVLNDAAIQLWRNDGRGVFTNDHYQVDYSSPWWSSSIGDMDSDTFLDIVIDRQSYWAGPLVDFPIFLNNGNARFNWSSNSPGPFNGEISGMVLSDINGDGFLDILSQIFDESIFTFHILINDGLGVFNPLPTPSISDIYYNHIAMGDLDGDGDVDFIGLSDEDWAIPEAEGIWLNQNQ